MTEMHENAAGYALAALDAAELAEFEVHLATCDLCQRAVAEFSRTAAALSLLTQATPPSRLRQNVLSVIQNVPQLPAADQPDERPGTPATTGGRRSIDGQTRPTGPRRALRTQRSPMSWRRARWTSWSCAATARNRILRGLVAAMLIVVVGLGGVIYTLVQQQRQAEVAAKPAYEEQLLRAEDARIVVSPTLQGGGRCVHRLEEAEPRPVPGHRNARSRTGAVPALDGDRNSVGPRSPAGQPGAQCSSMAAVLRWRRCPSRLPGGQHRARRQHSRCSDPRPDRGAG